MTEKCGINRRHVVIESLPHIGQEKDWDCGIACLRMVLRYINPNLSDVELTSACKDHNLGKSVWTIDLAYLCGKLGIRHELFTKTLGAQPDYARESFYAKSIESTYDEEQSRINGLFLNSEKNGINVQKKSIERTLILQHLEKEQPVIVLINDKLLVRNQGFFEGDIGEDALCCGCFCFNWCNQKTLESSEENYWGHYVVIVGYDMDRKVFMLNDPSFPGETIVCTFNNLDLARKSFGTDEDILFTYFD